jgi:hypothetical protein
MRLMLIPAILLCAAFPAAAQCWMTYVDRIDSFRVNFPGEREVEEISWDSERYIRNRSTDI